MKIKQIKQVKQKGCRRNISASVVYLVTPKGDESRGPRVVASGAINTLADDFAGGAKELELLCKGYHGTGDPVDHIVHAWRSSESERVTPAIRLRTIEITLKNLGYEDHPCVWVAHGDTDCPHLHLLVSRLNTDSPTYRIGGTGSSVQDRSMRNGKLRFQDNEALSLARAEAEVCRDLNFEPTPNALYGPDLQPATSSSRDPDGLKLRHRDLDQEARTGQTSPRRVLGETAMVILRSKAIRSWSDAQATLAQAGITLERIQRGPRSREGAILKTATGTRLKLSALPQDCSLKALDARWGAPDSGQTPPEVSLPNVPEFAVPCRLNGSKHLTLTQTKNKLKQIVVDSVDWNDMLTQLHRQDQGWTLERTGGGALIQAGEHRIKLSDLGRGLSYNNLSERWGAPIEKADIPANLLVAVRYSRTSFTPSQSSTTTPARSPGRSIRPTAGMSAAPHQFKWDQDDDATEIIRKGLQAVLADIMAGMRSHSLSSFVGLFRTAVASCGDTIDMTPDAGVVARSRRHQAKPETEFLEILPRM